MGSPPAENSIPKAVAVGKDYEVKVDTRNSGEGRLTGSITKVGSKSKSVVDCSEVDTIVNKDGTQSVRFKVKEKGEYNFDLRFGGEKITKTTKIVVSSSYPLPGQTGFSGQGEKGTTTIEFVVRWEGNFSATSVFIQIPSCPPPWLAVTRSGQLSAESFLYHEKFAERNARSERCLNGSLNERHPSRTRRNNWPVLSYVAFTLASAFSDQPENRERLPTCLTVC